MTQSPDSAAVEARRVKLTYRYRVKDKHAASLNSMANKVNFVWNFCNDTQKHALKWGKQWPSGHDLEKLSAGTSKELGIRADVIAKVCQQYEKSRRERRKPYLRYRGNKSPGWVPIKGRRIVALNNRFRCHNEEYSVWLSRPIPEGAKICDGSSLSQDSRGRWYLNVVIDIPATKSIGTQAAGIDLGLKSLATLSTGARIAAPRYYGLSQQKLAKAQRAKKKRQAKKIHDKIAAQRRDHHHKVTTNIVRQHGLIVIGNVNSSGLKKTRMAKSVSDAGWSSFRQMLAYKCDYAGARYMEVNEAFTTQTCSDCGVISGPKGREGLSVREWQCDCGSIHDRDVNSALNILRLGHETLTGAVL